MSAAGTLPAHSVRAGGGNDSNGGGQHYQRERAERSRRRAGDKHAERRGQLLRDPGREGGPADFCRAGQEVRWRLCIALQAQRRGNV